MKPTTSALRDAVGTVDFDVCSWGMTQDERELAEFGTPDFSRLFHEVTRPVP